MWMNSANRVEQSDAVSPLNHDVTGAFSRKGFVKKINRDPQWLDSLLVILFIFFIPAIDFILFAGSGNLQIVTSSYMPIPEVAIVLGGILVCASLLILPFHKKRMVKYSLAAVISTLFVYIIFSQFFLFRQGVAFGNDILPVSIIVSLLIGGITFLVFWQKRVFFKILYVIAFAVMFANVYVAYFNNNNSKEFEETYNIQKPNESPSERFIYLMMPNFESYAYMTHMDSDAARLTQNIMQGFFQKNKFVVYDAAYVPEDNYYANMIRSFNPTSPELSINHRMNTRLLDRYWNFHNLKNEYIYIKNNELYDLFRDRNFQISAYKSRDFDMCHQQHHFNVERCVEKINKPINLYNTSLPSSMRAGVLALEWITSMKVFGDISFVYNILGAFMNIDEIPTIGTDFNNLYVVNADKTFDILYDDIKNDKGKQAYFAFIDLPSNMYIYDEYCQLKPQNEWVTMANLPWIRRNYKNERENAYLQQTLCLVGKMEQFMDNLRADNLLQNTTIIIQGTSGVNNFSEARNDVSVESIINSRIVNMAIYDSNIDKYGIDSRFCATNQILTEYLFPDKKCENDLSDYHQKMVDTVIEELKIYNRNINRDNIKVFEEWYDKWLQYNSGELEAADIIGENYPDQAENNKADADFGINDINEATDAAPESESNNNDEANVDTLFEEGK